MEFRSGKQKIIVITAVLLLAFGILAVSYGPGIVKSRDPDSNQSLTARAIEQFHTRLSNLQFAEIYDTSHKLFQESQNREALIENMKRTRDRFGRFKNVISGRVHELPGTPVQIKAVYNTAYENGDATELFMFLKEGNDIRLAQYQISPGTVKID